MDLRKCTSINDATSLSITPLSFSDKVHAKAQVLEEQESAGHQAVVEDVDVDLREIYFLIMHFLSLGPCQRTFSHFWNELLEHQLLPRRYHAWYSRDGELSGDKDNDGISLPLSYDDVVQRYNHIGKDHLVMLLKQLILSAAPLRNMVGRTAPSAADVPTLLGTGPFSLFDSNRNEVKAQVKPLPSYLRWPHMQADQVRGLSLRELGGGFTKHHRAPSIRFACYAIAKPSTMLQKMENIKKLRGHRDAVYCAIFDRSGRYVITGSDDRLVKIWSMETAFCLASCRGHEGDITDLAVSSNNALVASASNDFTIRVWRLPDGMPISTLRGHEGAVTAIAFSPRQGLVYQLLSSSDDGTCRIWDARCSQYSPRIYLPRQTDAGKINGPSLSNTPQSHQILCCAYNASGSVFVTGSSDTFARVWSAGKSNADDSEQPHHEIDVLSGHENDVNYVQFSGTGVTSRSLTPDSLLDDKIPRYRSSWYSHDNIVTCSRDGSAIIWIPRSRRSHGKVGRWTRAYHLKVPPPPMPPQPPRGGPRQRLLPTPRGVNMIVWSLDNRFVLAAIMDNRICVWNASDGSLVHSLTGHTASTYVLDVHPFNPRIAMSAGYDGKTIIWDIWEGTPIRIYDTGRFKLVDGKFSLDGTSIVLSDDVGQIYLINTGQGESQKDSKYDQFFLGDYRPLTRDTNGNTVDQETQLAPYRRNIQDPLCDSSMLPYPEPYQSMYQRRRLGALNLEWRPSSIKFAVGTDIGLGQEIQILPLADLDIGFEPPPEFIDAMFWEPDDVMNDSTDSEYNITEEYSSEDEHGSLSSNSSDPECSTENKVERSHKDSLRRSKRKKHREEVDMSTSYGRRIKRRNPDVHDGTSSRSKRSKISRNDRSTKKKKSSLVKSLRPQRFSARNLKNSSSHVESSTDEDSPEDDSSESESVPQGYLISKREYDVKAKISKGVQAHSNEASVVGKQPILQTNTENRKKLILRFSIRDSKKSVLPPEDTRNQHHSQANVASSSSSRPGEENLNDNSINTSSGNPGLSLGNIEGGTSQEFVSGDLMPMLSDVIRQTDDAVGRNHSDDLKDNPRPKPTILRIKSKKAVTDSHSPLKIKLSHDVNASTSNGGDVISKIPNFMSTELADASYRREKFLEFKTHPGAYGGQELASTSEAMNHNQEEGSEVFAAVTEAMCRTRSMRFKTASRETYNENNKLKGRMSLRTSSSAEKSYKKVSDRLTSHESASTSGITSQSGTAQRKSNDAAIKSNWLLSSEQQLYRYIPQLYDEVMYFRQGHKEYNEKFKFHSLERALSRSFGENIRAVETCLVEDISYAYAAGSGESCCKIGLKFIDQSSKVYEKTFKLTLSDSNDYPDFVVEKTRYDAAIRRNWSLMDKCAVWWRHESGTGGTFWDGQITEDRSSKFPGSPWERYAVHYEGNDEPYYHSPWELHDSDTLWEPPEIDLHIRDIMLHSLSKLRKKQDKYGILKLEQHTQKSEYINGCALPLTLEIIEKRLQNNYYRNVDALGNDVMIMIENFQISFQKNAELTAKMKRLSNWFDRVLKRL